MASPKETEKLKAKAKKMYMAGYTMTSIGEEVGRDVSRISRWAKHGDWEEERNELYEEQAEDEVEELEEQADNFLEKYQDQHGELSVTDEDVLKDMVVLVKGLTERAKKDMMKIKFTNPYAVLKLLEFLSHELHLAKDEATEKKEVVHKHVGVLNDEDKEAIFQGLKFLKEHSGD